MHLAGAKQTGEDVIHQNGCTLLKAIQKSLHLVAAQQIRRMRFNDTTQIEQDCAGRVEHLKSLALRVGSAIAIDPPAIWAKRLNRSGRTERCFRSRLLAACQVTVDGDIARGDRLAANSHDIRLGSKLEVISNS